MTTSVPKQPSLQSRYPFQVFLIWVAGMGTVIGGSVLTGIALASLATTGTFAWPGSLGHCWRTLSGLFSHASNPADAYPADVQNHVATAAWAWAGAAVVTIVACGALWWITVVIQVRLDPRRHVEKQEGTSTLERDSSSAWARLSDDDMRDLVDNGDPLRWPLGWLDGVALAAPRLESVMVKAPTGGGKTSRWVVGAILRLCAAQVPKVITSIKMDAEALTWDAAQRSGPTMTFSPGRAESCQWAAFDGCGTAAGARTTAAWMSRSKKSETGGIQDMKFWEELGKKLLTPIIFACFRSGEGLTQMVRIIEARAEEKVTDLLDALLTETAGTPEERDVQDIFAMWRATCGREERQKSSVFSTAEVILAGFDHPEVRGLIGGLPGAPGVYTPGQLIDTRGTLYITSTKTKVDEYGAVFDALMAHLLYEVETRSHALGGLPIPTGLALLLEEAKNVATPPDLGYVASGMRGTGLMLASIWQDDGQIEETFGKAGARTVESNHSWKLYLPKTNDMDTLELLSKRIGTYRTIDRSHTESNNGGSTNIRYQDVPAATIRDLEELPADKAIVTGAGRKAIKVTTRPWFTDPAQRSQIPAAVADAFDNAFAPTRFPTGNQVKR